MYDAANNHVGQFIRDEWNRRLHPALGQLASHGTWVHLYLNGLYWGIYNPTERPDSAFMAAYFGGDKEHYDILKNHEEVVDGNGKSYEALLSLIHNDPLNFPHGYRYFSASEDYQAVREFIDPGNLITYLIPNMYSVARGWPGNNYVGRDCQSASEGFKFFSWKNEHGLKGPVNENLFRPHSRDSDSPTKFHRAFKSNAEYRLLFADHLHRAFFNGGTLALSAVSNQPAASWLVLSTEIETPLIAESARWGDYRGTQPYTVNDDLRPLRDRLLMNWFP